MSIDQAPQPIEEKLGDQVGFGKGRDNAAFTLSYIFVQQLKPGEVIDLGEHLRSLKTIRLNHTFPLGNGDSFLIDGDNSQIIYTRKLFDSKYRIEKRKIEFGFFKSKIPSLSWHKDGWKIGTGLLSGILSWNEVTKILKHVANSETYNRHKDSGEDHSVNLKVFLHKP